MKVKVNYPSIEVIIPFNFPQSVFDEAIPVGVVTARLRAELSWLVGESPRLGLHFHQHCIV